MKTGEKFDIAKLVVREMNCNEAKALIYSQGWSIPASWGACNWTNVHNKALAFKVSGHHFRGVVFLTVNGSDLYDFYLVNAKHDIIKMETDIFFDDLVERLDKAIEFIPEYIR
jgi:hypothetical protein